MAKKLRDLPFYGITAQKEMEEMEDKYREVFLELSNFELNSFITGKKFLIYGDKGTGKSAIIHYLHNRIGKASVLIDFTILQKVNDIGNIGRDNESEIKEKNNHNLITINNLEGEELFVTRSWRLFIIKTIIFKIKSDGIAEYIEFNSTKQFNKLYFLLNACYLNDYTKIIPRSKKGSYIVADKNMAFRSEFGDVEYVDSERYFSKIVQIFNNIQFKHNSKMYIIFDELNISWTTKKVFEQQIKQIQSLIDTVTYMNQDFKDKKLQFHIISSFRNEIMERLSGAERNKTISDYGIGLDWTIFNEKNNNKLIELVNKRLCLFDEEEKDVNNIWIKIFGTKSLGTLRNTILQYTWNKPRNIVSFFCEIKELYPDDEYLTKRTFNQVLSCYSRKAMQELMESLTFGLYPGDIHFLNRLILALDDEFDVQNFRIKRMEIAENYGDEDAKSIRVFTDSKLLEFMYQNGILGIVDNSRVLYDYLGKGANINQKSKFVLHKAVSLGRKSYVRC